MSWLHMEITSQLRCVLVYQFAVYFSTSELCYKYFSYIELTLELHFAFVRYFFTSQLRYLFVRYTYVCLRPHNYVIFCDTFELLMEMT